VARSLIVFGFLSALVLALFLILRPVVAAAGTPAVPDTAGRAKELLPEERADRTRGAAVTAAPAAKVTAGAPMETVEEQIVALANEARQAAGVPALTQADPLRRSARGHARDMIERGFVDSTNPNGLTPEDRASREDRRVIALVGETIASAPAKENDLARRIVAGWMGNPIDREKLVRPDFAQIGVGVVPGGAVVRTVAVFAHTVAVTDAPIPVSVAAGHALRVVLASADPSMKCNAVDLFSPGTGLSAGGPWPFGELPINVAPGAYRLRFHCTAGPATRVVSGPRIEVTP
jgi:uncharacterized protein YkwD